MKAISVLFIVLACLTFSDFKAAEAKYLPRPEPIEAQGSWIHAASGMIFPATVGDFQRISVLRYDEEGSDVSAGYNFVSPSGGIAATVYVYPAPSLVSIGSPPDVVAGAQATLCQNEFSARKTEVLNFHSGASLVRENDVSLPRAGIAFPGKMATFEFEDTFRGRRQPLRSELYVFCYVGKKWAFEYRFSSPKNFDAAGAVSAFMTQLPWTLSTPLK